MLFDSDCLMGKNSGRKSDQEVEVYLKALVAPRLVTQDDFFLTEGGGIGVRWPNGDEGYILLDDEEWFRSIVRYLSKRNGDVPGK